MSSEATSIFVRKILRPHECKPGSHTNHFTRGYAMFRNIWELIKRALHPVRPLHVCSADTLVFRPVDLRAGIKGRRVSAYQCTVCQKWWPIPRKQNRKTGKHIPPNKR